MVSTKDFQEYYLLLQNYLLRPREELLVAAADLGRQLLGSGVAVEDVAEMHEKALRQLSQENYELRELGSLPPISAPFMELLIAYGVAFRAQAERQRRAERALRESEAKFRKLSEMTTAGIFIFQDQHLRYANPAAEKITGYSAEELTNMMFWEIIHPDFRETVRERGLARQRGEHVPGRYEVQIIAKSGDIRWVDFSASLFELQGRPAVIGTAIDITDQKRAELALKKEMERNRQILQTTMDGYILADTEGRIIDVNPAYCDLVGYTRDELLQMTICDVEARLNPREIRERIAFMVEQGWARFETQHRHKSGRIVDIEVSIVIMQTSQGPLVAAFCRDVTEKKKLEAQFLQAQKMETIGTLAGGVAHDFNNLLTAILGNAGFGLQDLRPGDPGYEYFQEIEKAATKASDLTSQLLSFSRRQAVNKIPVSLNQIVEDLVKMLRRILGEDITLQIELAPDSPLIFADPGRIQQLLMNLSTNARDAMPSGGSLTLTCKSVRPPAEVNSVSPNASSAQEWVCLKVADTGVGIAPENVPRIYDPFFTTKEVGKGTGLGLAVVHGIVQQHEGRIEVESTPGAGTTFRIYFPRYQGAFEMRQGQQTVDVQPGTGETILLIEDERAVRDVTVRLLNSLSYKVLVAQNGREAVDLMKTEGTQIKMAILDVVMPGESGPEVFQKLAAFRPDLPVLFITGYDAEAKLADFGFDAKAKNIDILCKPFTRDLLGKKVFSLLYRKTGT